VNPLTSTLELGPRCVWFRSGYGARVDLSQRNALRRTLYALVEERRERPGQAASHQELFEEIWPGEPFEAAKAKNRLRVAIYTLRRLGLDGAIVTVGDRYLLDPELPLAIDRAA
jgi:DNA-binding response OmpR family regulator